MNDLISRSALLKEFEIQNKVYRPNELWHWTGIKAMIGCQPTVEPVRGEWKHRKSWDKYVCSVCSYEHDAVSNFCEQCGADMRGGQNGRT